LPPRETRGHAWREEHPHCPWASLLWAAVWVVGARPPGSTAHVLLILLITVGKQTGNDDADNLEWILSSVALLPRGAAVTSIETS
jgi:hypothetical protein